MTTSLPSWRSASVIDRSEPSASPSGFSWVVTRKRSLARSASATACRSVVVPWGELIDELGHAHAALDRRIVLECQLRGPLHPELPSKARLQHSVRGFESAEARCALLLGAEDADVHGRLAKIGRGLDSCHRHESDARVLQLDQCLCEDLPDRLVHASHTVGHRGYSSGCTLSS